MAGTRLTETVVKCLRPPPCGNRIVYDAELKGFGARVTAGNAKAFVLNYRFEGRERRLTIGSFPEWSVAGARRQAESLKRLIDVGRDPMAERHEARDAATVNDLCDLYIDRHLPGKRPSSRRDDLSMIRRFIKPNLGNAKVKSLRHSDIETLHLNVSRRTPMTANRIVSLLSKMLALSVKWDMRTDNPTKGIRRNPEAQRDRYLDESELPRLCQALASYPNSDVSDALALLLVTGARKNEVLSARWSMFDLKIGVWTKPGAQTKQKKMHRVPLSTAALAILNKRKAVREDEEHDAFLFPTQSKSGHLTELKGAWSRICQLAQIRNVRIHDLRHTYASYLASSGQPLAYVGALLGHTQSQTTQRYAHLQDNPLRVATEVFSEIMSASTSAKMEEKS